MIGSVLPLRDLQPGVRLHSIVPLHVLGSVLAAVFLGAGLGLMGEALLPPISAPASILVASTIALAYGLHDIGILQLPRVELRQQVPHAWRLRFRPGVASLLYGAGLGLGVVTYITVSSLYVVLVWAMLSQDLLQGALVMGIYGLSRAVPVIAFSFLKDSSMERIDRALSGLGPMKQPILVVNGLALTLAGTFMTTSALRLT